MWLFENLIHKVVCAGVASIALASSGIVLPAMAQQTGTLAAPPNVPLKIPVASPVLQVPAMPVMALVTEKPDLAAQTAPLAQTKLAPVAVVPLPALLTPVTELADSALAPKTSKAPAVPLMISSAPKPLQFSSHAVAPGVAAYQPVSPQVPTELKLAMATEIVTLDAASQANAQPSPAESATVSAILNETGKQWLMQAFQPKVETPPSVTPAFSGPKSDLVIVPSGSFLAAGGCEKHQPLAAGRIIIRNIGDARTYIQPGRFNRGRQSLIAVYSPQHLDIIGLDYDVSSLAAGEEIAARITIGQGATKAGRFMDVIKGPPLVTVTESDRPSGQPQMQQLDPNILLDLGELSRGEIQDIQKALKQLSYYRGRIDGIMGNGTRQAVRQLQQAVNASPTGALTIGQVLELESRAKTSLSIGSSGYQAVALRPLLLKRYRKHLAPRTFRVPLVAVVDPYNLVREADERNNILAMEVEVRCPH